MERQLRNIILEFAEKTALAEMSDAPFRIEYSSGLNLNVILGTQTPAIDVANLGTQSFTKTKGEVTDPDRSPSRSLLGTMTQTDVQREMSDEDPTGRRMLSTHTFTEVARESTDNDR